MGSFLFFVGDSLEPYRTSRYHRACSARLPPSGRSGGAGRWSERLCTTTKNEKKLSLRWSEGGAALQVRSFRAWTNQRIESQGARLPHARSRAGRAGCPALQCVCLSGRSKSLPLYAVFEVARDATSLRAPCPGHAIGHAVGLVNLVNLMNLASFAAIRFRSEISQEAPAAPAARLPTMGPPPPWPYARLPAGRGGREDHRPKLR